MRVDAKDRSRVQRSPCPIPEPVPASTEDHPQQRPAVQAAPPGPPWPAEKHGNGQGSWTLSWTRNPMPRTEARWQQTPIRGQRPDPTQRQAVYQRHRGF